jgi:hypothetical protein
VGESAAGISRAFGDSGAELQRAQDKIATMQARADAVDELIHSDERADQRVAAVPSQCPGCLWKTHARSVVDPHGEKIPMDHHFPQAHARRRHGAGHRARPPLPEVRGGSAVMTAGAVITAPPAARPGL